MYNLWRELLVINFSYYRPPHKGASIENNRSYIFHIDIDIISQNLVLKWCVYRCIGVLSGSILELKLIFLHMNNIHS